MVTLKDVAREAGVHVSTASRALNPETRSVVNAKTARRIEVVAERLGYRPHPLARGLRTNRTLTVGIVVPDLMNPLFPPIYAGAEATLREQGYSLVIAGVDDDEKRVDAVVSALLERRVAGLILATAHRETGLPGGLKPGGMPIVQVMRSDDSLGLPSVVADDHAGIGLVVRHLVDLGHTAIAHIAGPSRVSTGLTRRQAFVASSHNAGIAAEPELIVEAGSFRIEAGREACERLLDSGRHFTAIVAANDLIALGCYDALHARGIDVPGSVSVTGYNDMPFVDRVTPPLTTVAVPFRQMGSAAGELLLSEIALKSSESADGTASTLLRPWLVVRGSSGPGPVE